MFLLFVCFLSNHGCLYMNWDQEDITEYRKIILQFYTICPCWQEKLFLFDFTIMVSLQKHPFLLALHRPRRRRARRNGRFRRLTIWKSSHCDNLIHVTSVVGFHSWVRSQWIFLPCSCYSSCQSIFFQPLRRWCPISLLGEIFFHVWVKHCPSDPVTTINIWFL